MNTYQIILLCAFAIFNLIGYMLMAIDKKRAIKGEWRIKERTLMFWAGCFGGAGATIAMLSLRHKTQHWYFRILLPMFALVQCIMLPYAYYYLSLII